MLLNSKINKYLLSEKEAKKRKERNIPRSFARRCKSSTYDFIVNETSNKKYKSTGKLLAGRNVTSKSLPLPLGLTLMYMLWGCSWIASVPCLTPSVTSLSYIARYIRESLAQETIQECNFVNSFLGGLHRNQDRLRSSVCSYYKLVKSYLTLKKIRPLWPMMTDDRTDDSAPTQVKT